MKPMREDVYAAWYKACDLVYAFDVPTYLRNHVWNCIRVFDSPTRWFS